MAAKISLTGEQLSEVANAMVRLKAEYYGRGPSAAKAYLNDEVLICVLRGGLTAVERTLLAGGDEDLVRQVRLRWQEQLVDRFSATVAGITGYRVLAFNSQILFDPDYIIEMAVLGDGDGAG
jgi:uncharacterized protein YbcI